MQNYKNHFVGRTKSPLKKMRRLCMLLAVTVLLSLSAVFVGFDRTQDKVYDDAGLLTPTQKKELEKLMVDSADKIQCDIIIVTTNDNEGKSAMDYAEDFFMAHDFGYDEIHGDAVLMLIDMDGREIWISTSGRAIDVLSDARIGRLLDNVAEELGSDLYYRACKVFVNGVVKYFNNPEGQDKYEDYHSSADIDFVDDGGERFQNIGIKILIALGISLLTVLMLRYRAKAKMTVDGHYYAKNHGCQVLRHSDNYVRTTVTKTARVQSSGGGSRIGGGHSSVHRGSGGHHFGGGGRRF